MLKASRAGPGGLAVDAALNVFSSDRAHNRIVVLTAAGVTIVLAGSGASVRACRAMRARGCARARV